MADLTLLNLLDAKLAYTSQRQAVLAANIAQADTPGFRPMDVEAPDFKAILAGKSASGITEPLKLTNMTHIPVQPDGLPTSNVKEASSFYGVKPSGNAVDIEEQMLKASKNKFEADVAINMYVKQLSLLRTAIGANGR